MLGPHFAYILLWPALGFSWLDKIPSDGYIRMSLVALPMILWTFVSFLLCRLYTRGLRRRLVAAEGRLCTHCCYDLSAHDEKGICPECSTAYSFGELRQVWRDYRLLKQERTSLQPNFNLRKARIPKLLCFGQFAIVMGAALAVILLPSVLMSGWLDKKWWAMYSDVFLSSRASYAFALCPLIGLLLCNLYTRRLRRRLVAAEGRLCTNCCYDLSAHDEKGICPECSTAYSVGELRQDWRKYRLLKDTPPVL